MNAKTQNYILALDLGVASVGWGVVGLDEQERPNSIIDLGVRLFDKSEDPKTGESLNSARRAYRLQRNAYKSKKVLVKQVKALLLKHNLLQNTELSQHNLSHKTWELRVKALDNKLSNKELASILIHIAKNRGFQTKANNSDDKKAGLVLSSISNNHQLLNAYRSVAELAVKHFQLNDSHIRNKAGNYTHSFARQDIVNEIELIFKNQRQFGNQNATIELEKAYIELINYQKPSLTGESLLKMVGKCTFEKEQYRAPKASYSAERFILLSSLTGLKVLENGEQRTLTQSERELLIQKAYELNKITYAQIRKWLGLSDSAIFNFLRYQKLDKVNAETKVFVELKHYHQLRKAFENANLENEWNVISNNGQLLDSITYVLTICKEESEIRQKLAKLNELNDKMIDVLANIRFTQFINLSLVCLNKINPLMENGKTYLEATSEIYGAYNRKTGTKLNSLLPVIPVSDISNPVVLRTVTQARKVINAVIRKYGQPAYIHIESGRDLGKSYQERQEITRQQAKNAKENEKLKERLVKEFNVRATNSNVLKLKLYEQQNGKCLYSGKTIDSNKLFANGYVEIDHALPYSRTYDDSANNKVLVLASENQTKRNRTPFEWLNGADNSAQWQNFKSLVEASDFAYQKKQKLLTKQLADNEFKARNLSDTRYINAYLSKFIADNLLLVGKGKQKVFTPNGRITSFLRYNWGLTKNRQENARHHALDAIVIACANEYMQKEITQFAQKRECNKLAINEYIDIKTGEIKQLTFPEPWAGFSKELTARVYSDDLKAELADMENIDLNTVKPLFISRMPTRGASGQGHKETIKSVKNAGENRSVKRVDLKSLNLDMLERFVAKDTEKALYKSLKKRLEESKNDPLKAFTEPLKQRGKVVRAIKVWETQKSGLQVRNGIADNGDTVRIDIYTKDGKNYIIPVYAHHIAKKVTPNAMITNGKTEDEWDKLDDTYQFKFSLFPNDLIKISNKKERFIGYYKGADRSNGGLTLLSHDCVDANKIKRFGPKTATIEKLEVDVLGNVTGLKA